MTIGANELGRRRAANMIRTLARRAVEGRHLLGKGTLRQLEAAESARLLATAAMMILALALEVLRAGTRRSPFATAETIARARPHHDEIAPSRSWQTHGAEDPPCRQLDQRTRRMMYLAESLELPPAVPRPRPFIQAGLLLWSRTER